MRFAVLGPVTVTRDSAPVPVSSRMGRTLLALLLVNADRTVPVHRLVGALWGDTPPPTATASLHNHVMRLRRVLGPDGAAIQRTPDGYLISLRPGQLDLHEFDDRCRRGRAALAEGRWLDTADALSAALGLWRGEPLADVPVVNLDTEDLDHIHETRLQAIEGLAEARLRLGQYGQVISELRPVVREHPWAEALHGQLMRAFYGAGRQADALKVYRDLRQELVDELGVEPSPAVRELHQRILDADAAVETDADGVDLPAGGLSTARPPVKADPPSRPSQPVQQPVPQQLPPTTRYFAARSDALATLFDLLDDTGDAPGAARIATITGTAGVGKTALAVHWAHQCAERFPDGRLYVNLRGFDPAGQPVTAEHAVRGFLDGLGMPPGRIPAAFEAQVALYRSLVAGRRLLVVLDNARDAEQVRPLLPGTATCPVLVTSRNRLASLVAIEGAQLLPLDLLTVAEARELLARRLGPETVAREAASVDELIELCARLPLALSVVAARLAMNPGFPFATLLARLADTRDRLATLNAGDTVTDVRAVFSWSYEQLSGPAARLFRLLSVHPGPDVSLPAAACLADLTPTQARAALDELADSHLLTEHAPGRYASHDLLRAYAADLARTVEDEPGRRAAAERMLDHYLHTAYAAERLIYPARDPITLRAACPGAVPEDFATAGAAMAWYDAEHLVLLAAGAAAADSGFDTQAWQLPWALTTYLVRSGRWHDVRTSQRAGLAAARRLGELRGQALAHRVLGQLCREPDERETGGAHLREALDLERRLGSLSGQADVLHSLAFWYELGVNYPEALDHAQQALELHRAAGHPSGQARLLNAVGWYRSRLGDHEQALVDCQEALALIQGTGDRNSEAQVLNSLGHLHQTLGQTAQAVSAYRQSVDVHRENGHRPAEADALVKLGDAHRAAGDLAEAQEHWRAALAILTDLGRPDAEEVRAKLSA
ncbi:BTAD domain-containing putative transcriptional regulator [Kitasatospora sp. MAP5-34]|uniref:AfsR/SARP family transcriptional regulator n=1 Tax=Kitasatospora sp. MAP5-34 TaxID=3035102 RepID=UPI0024750F20|nr:BTAD domain-containing putative transcriptional regulator [Kitasatospora sp. MAP5-34]MDH6579455.1 DNA-binding SARP family transcriptional activator/Tfp pilus assembly protein PilF [Kitasatospora sp. MAP5-34]